MPQATDGEIAFSPRSIKSSSNPLLQRSPVFYADIASFSHTGNLLLTTSKLLRPSKMRSTAGFVSFFFLLGTGLATPIIAERSAPCPVIDGVTLTPCRDDGKCYRPEECPSGPIKRSAPCPVIDGVTLTPCRDDGKCYRPEECPSGPTKRSAPCPVIDGVTLTPCRDDGKCYRPEECPSGPIQRDRKSTRLNSNHRP